MELIKISQPHLKILYCFNQEKKTSFTLQVPYNIEVFAIIRVQDYTVILINTTLERKN